MNFILFKSFFTEELPALRRALEQPPQLPLIVTNNNGSNVSQSQPFSQTTADGTNETRFQQTIESKANLSQARATNAEFGLTSTASLSAPSLRERNKEIASILERPPLMSISISSSSSPRMSVRDAQYFLSSQFRPISATKSDSERSLAINETNDDKPLNLCIRNRFCSEVASSSQQL